jgi:hypothetical protein
VAGIPTPHTVARSATDNKLRLVFAETGTWTALRFSFLHPGGTTVRHLAQPFVLILFPLGVLDVVDVGGSGGRGGQLAELLGVPVERFQLGPVGIERHQD